MLLGALAVLSLTVTGCASNDLVAEDDAVATLPSASQAQIDEAVTTAMELSGSTQAVIGVWTPSGDYVRAYTTQGAPEVDGNALFRGAQTTQPALCALLLDMVDAGELTLDREVSRDIPRLVGIGNVTYGQLCDATSGFADYKRSFTDDFITNPTRDWPAKEFISESLIRPRLSWPGLDVHRSDTNAHILGHALTVVGGAPLAEQLEKRVFTPAEMAHSYMPADRELTIDSDNALTGLSYPVGPDCQAEPIVLDKVSPSILGAAGATITTVSDIKRLYTSYLGGEFGGPSASVITDTRSTKNPKRDEEGNPVEEDEEVSPTQTYRGFGILNIGPLWGYDGSMPGSITSAWHDPDTGFTVVVALNNSTAGASFATRLAHQIAAVTDAVGDLWTVEDQAAALQEAAVCQTESEEE